MRLEMKSGRIMTAPDHTDWFHRKYNSNQVAILAYHDTVIKGACSKRCAGSMDNIKQLARYTYDHIPLEILIQDGEDMVNLLKRVTDGP